MDAHYIFSYIKRVHVLKFMCIKRCIITSHESTTTNSIKSSAYEIQQKITQKESKKVGISDTENDIIPLVLGFCLFQNLETNGK